jgi:hypothetical protein
MTHAFGIEIETAGRPVQPVIDALRANGLRGFVVKPDGTPSVDAEIVLPPLPDTEMAWEYVRERLQRFARYWMHHKPQLRLARSYQ